MCAEAGREPDPGADALLSVEQVAERLELTVQGTFMLIQRGKLPAIAGPDGKPRVTDTDLGVYVARQRERVEAFLRAQRR